jgi:hypothetical protein
MSVEARPSADRWLNGVRPLGAISGRTGACVDAHCLDDEECRLALLAAELRNVAGQLERGLLNTERLPDQPDWSIDLDPTPPWRRDV